MFHRVRAAVMIALASASLLSSIHAAPAEPVAAVAPSTPLPISDFVRPTDFSDVTLSPDGKYLAALVPKIGNPHENILAVLDGKTGKILHAIPSGQDALVANYFWGDDDRLIAALAIRESGLDTPMLTGELFAIDPDGSRQTQLFGYRARKGSASLIAGSQQRYAVAWPIQQQYISDNQILVATREFSRFSAGTVLDIERLNVNNGKSLKIGQGPARNAWMVADHAGQVRAAYADNDYTGTRLWLRKDNDAPWQLVNEPGTSHVELTPIGFNRDNSKLYVRSASSDGPSAIELIDMQTQKRTVLYRGTYASPGQLLPTADKKDYYAVTTEDGRSGLHYFDEDSTEARLNRALADSFPGQSVSVSSFTRDGQRAVIHVQSDRNPGDFYLFDLATRNAQLIAHAQPWIDPRRMRPMEPIQVTARDGIVMHGFITTPAGAKPYPMVVLPHGGPHGIHDEWGYDPEVQLLASRGYAVLQINYRGSGGYGSGFEHLGYRQWGLSMQDDITDATRWAITQGYADAHRVCIYGGSYGGYAALEGAVREPDLYRCAAGYAGVYDLRVQLDKSDTQESDMGMAYLQLVLGTDRDDLLKRSPLGGVAKIKADVLLIHGESDPRVPFKNFQEFTHALDQQGKHYETVVEAGEGHGFFVPEHREEAYRKLLDFLARNTTPESPVTAAGNAVPTSVKAATLP